MDAVIQVYDRDVRTNDLELIETIPISTSGDNIDVDVNGSIWVGNHFQLFTFLRAIADTSMKTLAPSQIIKISYPNAAKQAVVETAYFNEGLEIMASTVFASWQGKVGLIGTVLDNKILLCEL
jgi:hypothetical protein